MVKSTAIRKIRPRNFERELNAIASARTILEALHSKTPDDARYDVALAEASCGAGVAHETLSQYKDAVSDLQEASDIARRLMTTVSLDAELVDMAMRNQSSLWRAYYYLGDAAGMKSAALDGLEMAKQRSVLLPDSRNRWLSWWHEQIGFAEQMERNHGEAVHSYEAAIASYDGRPFPNSNSDMVLAYLYTSLGSNLRHIGENDRSDAAFVRAVEEAEKVTSADPQSNAAEFNFRVGLAYFETEHPSLDKAERYVRRAISILESFDLVERDRHAINFYKLNLKNLLLSQGKFDDATAMVEQVRADTLDQLKQDPNDRTAYYHLGSACSSGLLIACAQDDLAAARTAFDQDLQHWNEGLQNDMLPAAALELGIIYKEMLGYLDWLKEQEQPRIGYENACRVWEFWSQVSHQRDDAVIPEMLKRSALWVEIFAEDAKPDDFDAVEAQIIDTFRNRSEPSMWDEAAWRMAINSGAAFYDPQAALQFAQQAADEEPQHQDYGVTLGLAQYRCGLFAEAKTTLEGAANSGKLDECVKKVSACLLALVNLKLENHFDASRWSKKAESLPGIVFPEVISGYNHVIDEFKETFAD
ncbi:MAG: hypothetical protein R3E01_19160 [Pirellulaceae bacterium]